MDKITEYEVTKPNGKTVLHILINRPDGSFLDMTKEYWETQQAEQSTPILPPDNYLTPPDTIESTQPDEADLTEGTN